MNAEDMRFEIESVYAAVLETKKPSVRTGQELPANITPLSWHLQIPATAEGLTAAEFRVQFGDHAAEELALLGLEYGCTQFAKLTVRERDFAQVRGHMKTHKRERAFIVHALGWKGTR